MHTSEGESVASGVSVEPHASGICQTERLQRAIKKGDLSTVYHPKIDAQSGRIASAEALIRWFDPEIGVVSPASFVPLAEATGLIQDLGLLALDHACADAAMWPNCDKPAVAVNVSSRQLQNEGFVDQVGQVLAKHTLPAHRLVLELTEHTVVEEEDVARQNVEALNAIGVSFALDDFGTGYANFPQLQNLPLQALKIDKGFLNRDVGTPESTGVSESIIRTIVELGHALNLTVIAEGVETAAQEDALVRAGCDRLQGFRYCQPLSANEFWHLLAGHRGLAHRTPAVAAE